MKLEKIKGMSREQLLNFLGSMEIKTSTDLCSYWGGCSALEGLSDAVIGENLNGLCLGNYPGCPKYIDLEAGR